MLKSQRSVTGTPIKVKFLEMVEDSRCAADVQCVWAGNAKIKVEVMKGNKSEVMELNSALPNPDGEFAGYRFKLMKLTPAPRSNIRIDQSKYTATIEVTKTGK